MLFRNLVLLDIRWMTGDAFCHTGLLPTLREPASYWAQHPGGADFLSVCDQPQALAATIPWRVMRTESGGNHLLPK